MAALNPVEKARMVVFKNMTPSTQALAQDVEEKLIKGASGVLQIHYDIGVKLHAAVSKESTEYGDGAVEQLATYLAIPGGATMLYALMKVTQTFSRDEIKAIGARLMANGAHVSLNHVIHLSKIEDNKKRGKMQERIFSESMSANDLEKEIRAGSAGSTKNARQGGRKPKVPSSPILGLQTTWQLANKFVNWQDVAEKTVFDKLDEMAPDKVTQNLIEKTEKTLQIMTSVVEKAEGMKEHLEGNLDRLKEIMEKRAESAAEEYTEEDGNKAKKKAKAENEDEDGSKKKKIKKVVVEEEGEETSEEAAPVVKKKKKKVPVAAE